jgi:hypothetical protein
VTPTIVAVLAAATLLASGCSSPPAYDEARPRASTTLGAVDGRTPHDDAGFASPPPVDEAAADLQERVLADGEVTPAEYEQATQATVDCVRAEGYTVEGPARYPDAPVYHSAPGADPRDYLYWAATGVDDDEAFYAVSDRCTAEWSERVEAAWQAQHAPSEEEVQAWLERAWECMRERGLPLSDPPTDEEADLSIQHGCRPWETGG